MELLSENLGYDVWEIEDIPSNTSSDIFILGNKYSYDQLEAIRWVKKLHNHANLPHGMWTDPVHPILFSAITSARQFGARTVKTSAHWQTQLTLRTEALAAWCDADKCCSLKRSNKSNSAVTGDGRRKRKTKSIWRSCRDLRTTRKLFFPFIRSWRWVKIRARAVANGEKWGEFKVHWVKLISQFFITFQVQP